jgi:hypothetical protein
MSPYSMRASAVAMVKTLSPISLSASAYAVGSPWQGFRRPVALKNTISLLPYPGIEKNVPRESSAAEIRSISS